MDFVESATKISLGKKKRVIPRFWRNSKNKMLVHSRKMPEKQTILTVFRDGEIFKSLIRQNVLRLLTKYAVKIVIVKVNKAGCPQASLWEGGGSRSETEGACAPIKAYLFWEKSNIFCTHSPSPACGRELPPGGSLRFVHIVNSLLIRRVCQ